MAVKIRLKRMGKIRQPYFRVVVVDSRKKRDGKVIEEIGKYHPKQEPSFIEVESERAQYWLGVGAQPSEAVEALFKLTGDWQKFKGLPGTEGTVKVADPKRDKAEIFAEALKDAANEPKADATTKKRAAKKAAAGTGESDEQKAATEQVEAAVEEQGPNPADAATTEEAAAESTDGSADTTEAAADSDVKVAQDADEATPESAESKA